MSHHDESTGIDDTPLPPRVQRVAELIADAIVESSIAEREAEGRGSDDGEHPTS